MSTVEKALGLLEKLSVSTPEIGLTEFKSRTGLDKGTLYRYLTSLKNSGLLEQNPETKAYRLGPAVIRLAAVREKTVPLIKSAAPVVNRLADATGELVHASVPESEGMTTLYFRDGGTGGTRVWLDDSEVLPFHATSSGLAYLAFSSHSLRERVRTQKRGRFTDQTPLSDKDITKHIKAAQANGYAFANQFFEAEVCSVALPFFGRETEPQGTIAVAMPTSRMNEAACLRLARLLADASRDLSHDIGGNIPPQLSDAWQRL